MISSFCYHTQVPLLVSKTDQAKTLKSIGLLPWLRSDDHTDSLSWNIGSLDKALKEVKAKLASSDRNLVRIDRRVEIGKYEGEQELEKTLIALLEALDDSFGTRSDRSNLLATCREEVLEAFRCLRRREGEMGLCMSSASFLSLGPNEKDSNSIKEIYQSVPTPWCGRCAKCDKNLFGDAEKEKGPLIRKCDNCHSIYHSKCAAKMAEKTISVKGNSELTSVPLLSLIKSYDPLKELFKLRISPSSPDASTVEIPDYTGELKDHIQWQEQTVTIRRNAMRIGGRQELEPYSINLQSCVTCRDKLKTFLEGGEYVWHLQELRKTIMFAVPFDGMLVCRVGAGSAAERAGLRVDDVIESVEFIRFLGKNGKNGFGQKKYELSSMPSDAQKKQLFLADATEVKLRVRRPNKTIHEKAKKLERYLLTQYSVDETVLETARNIWLCPRCYRREISTDHKSLLWEARSARAVLRYIASQPYGQKLWFERALADDEIALFSKAKKKSFHHKCVSLGRLDLMMDAILYKENFHDSMKASTYFGFTVGGQRLSWAIDLEEHPLKLLCTGISLLSDSIQEVDIKEAFLSDFCKVFCAWSLSSSRASKTFPNSTGPYAHALHVTRPFESIQVCSQCLLREIPQGHTGICETCNLLTRKQDSAGVVPGLYKDNKLLYEERAGLVGRIVLVRPTHPLLLKTIEEFLSFNYKIEPCGRPFEMLVASYLPQGYCREEHWSHDGVFHLLPLTPHEHQVQYLVDKSMPRGFAKRGLSESLIKEWMSDELLSLAGVVKLGFHELSALISDSEEITKAAFKEVSRQALCLCTIDDPPHLDGSAVEYDSYLCSKASCSSWRDLNRFKNDISHCCRQSYSSMDDFVSSHNPVFNEIRRAAGVEVDDERDGLGMWETPFMIKNIEKPVLEAADVFVPQVEDKQIVYTDIFFSSRTACRNFMESNKKMIVPESDLSTCLLELRRKSSGSTVPELCGWGIELVRDELGGLWVGRVLPKGPAFTRGLRSGDQIITLNGKPAEKLSTPFSLACALLGAPSWLFLGSQDDFLVSANVLKAMAKKEIALAPLLLSVRRGQAPPWNPSPPVVAKTSLAAADRPLGTGKDVDTSLGGQSLPVEVVDLTAGDEHEDPAALIPVQPAAAQQPHAALPPHTRHTAQMSHFPTPLPQAIHGVGPPLIPQEGDVLLGMQGLFLRDPPKSFKSNIVSFARRLKDQWTPDRIKTDIGYAVSSLFDELQPHCRFLLQVSALGSNNWRAAGKMEASQALKLSLLQALKMIDQQRLSQPSIINAKLEPIIRSITTISSFGTAQPLTLKHLDVQSPFSCLTMAELSVLLTSIQVNQPILGMRLLLPRYRIKTLMSELETLGNTRPNFSQINTLPDLFWNMLLRFDYKRALEEASDAPRLLVDRGSGYSYAFPVVRCPIDRLLSEFLNLDMRTQTAAIKLAEDMAQLLISQTRRIRGGGGTCDEENPLLSLADISRANWNGKIVTWKQNTEDEDAVQEDVKVLGRVIFTGPYDDSVKVKKIDVRIVWTSSKGVTSHLIVQKKPKNVWVVKEGSGDHGAAVRSEAIQKTDSTDHVSEGKGKGPAILSGEPLPSETKTGKDHSDGVGTMSKKKISLDTAVSALSGIDSPPLLNSGSVGLLPDGREVMFFQSNPEAIFIQREWTTASVERLSSSFKKAFSAKGLSSRPYLCVWGCCEPQDSENAWQSFESINQLQDHLQRHHTFGSRSMDSDLFEIVSPRNRLELLRSITNSLVSLCPGMKKYAIEMEDGRLCFNTESLFSGDTRRCLLDAFQECPKEFRYLFPLCFQLWQLFPYVGDSISKSRYARNKFVEGADLLKMDTQICCIDCGGEERDLGCVNKGGIGSEKMSCFCTGRHGSRLEKARMDLTDIAENIPKKFLVPVGTDASLVEEVKLREEFLEYFQQAETVSTLNQGLMALVASTDMTNFPR